MKISKLLVLGAFCLTTTSAMADLVDGVRQRPNITSGETFAPDQVYYLFNVKARQFFCGANDWETRASVSPDGVPVNFVDLGDNAPIAGAYEFTDSVVKFKEWRSVFTDDGTAIWVDDKDGKDYRFWNVEAQADNVYRLSNKLMEASYPDFVGAYLGWGGNDADTRLYFLKPEAEGAGVDWLFVTKAAFDTYQEAWTAMKEQFEKAAELLTVLNQAKEQKVDVAAEQAIYENEQATVEELDAAILAVQKRMNEAIAGDASVQNPSIMTASLVNADFETHTAEGWKGTAPNMNGDGNHLEAGVAEHYNKNFDTYQELSGMPKGVYKLSANVALRTNWEDHANHTNYVAYLYGKADNDTLTTEFPNFWDAMNTTPMAGSTEFGTNASESSNEDAGTTYYIPNDPSAGRLYFEKGYYHKDVFFALEGDDPIRVGVMKNKAVTGSDWALFDNFQLTFYGNAPEAYQYWIDNTDKVDYSEAVVSASYKEAYNQAFQVTVGNKAEALAALKVIKAASDSISTNAQLWRDLEAEYSKGEATLAKYQDIMSESAGILSDLLDMGTDDFAYGIKDLLDATDKEGDFDLTNKTIQDYIDEAERLIELVEADAKNALQPGADVTEYLTNPDFEKSSTGWTVVSKGGGNVQHGGNADNHCYEAWHSTNFDVYQEVKNLPLGVYEISVQGYVRYLDGQDAINNKANEPENVPIYVYMNDSKTNMPSWFSSPRPISFFKAVSGANYLSEDDDNAYPDNMIAASAVFKDGGYKASAKGLVANAGDVMRIGVKGTPAAQFWPIFDNFKLTYLGFAVEVVRPELEAAIEQARRVASEWSLKAAATALNTTLDDAQTKVDGTNGKEMFAALAALTKAVADFEDGQAVVKELYDQATELMQLASASTHGKAVEAQGKASDILGYVEANEVEDADALKQTIREYSLLLQLPDNYTNGGGADVTAFIQTPGFEKTVGGTTTNAIDGWMDTAGYNFGNDANQKAALALEYYEKTFNMYQDLEGVGSVVLPDGFYKVQVYGFERVSESTPAYLYAESGSNKEEVELIKLADGVDTSAGETAPNDMVTAKDCFDQGKYLNELSIKVEGGKLRVGIKHEANSGSDWIIMDDFKLLYFGDEDPTGVETLTPAAAQTVRVQYFTLDGRQVNGAQKGIIIRKATLSDGNVIVKKIQK